MGALALPALVKSPGLAGLAGLAGDLLGTKTTGALFTKVLQARTVEDSLIDHFDLRKRYHVEYWEDARAKLQSRTVIAEDKKSGLISISVRDRDPEFAANLANAYVAELDHVMLQVATSAARRERLFIEQRLREEKKVLDDAEARFSKFASSSMALDIPQQTRVMVESAARLQGELIASRAELEGLEQIYTPENTRVRTLQARVNELQRALDRINTGANASAPVNGSNPYPSVKKLPLVGLEWTDLYRNTKIHETVYELLTQQYEVARIQEAREIPTVKVLDVAVVPERRHPSRGSVIFIGAFLSAILACIAQILRYRWEKWDADDPRRILIASIVPRRRRTTASVGRD
jgi:capsule polysaccharide export protein KpsE/RkpR